MNETSFKKIYEETHELSKLKETISGLECYPVKLKHSDRFNKWIVIQEKSIRFMIFKRLRKIKKYGAYGKLSHKCNNTTNLIFEIVFKDPPIRIYFTVLSKDQILLEDGSSKKTGGGQHGEQERTIEALDKLISQRKNQP